MELSQCLKFPLKKLLPFENVPIKYDWDEDVRYTFLYKGDRYIIFAKDLDKRLTGESLRVDSDGNLYKYEQLSVKMGISEPMEAVYGERKVNTFKDLKKILLKFCELNEYRKTKDSANMEQKDN